MTVWWWLAACDDTTFPAVEDSATGVSFDDVRGVFTADCLACHSTGQALGGLDLETDPCDALVGVPSQGDGALLVIPGDAASSVLWTKLGPTPPFGDAMPPPDGGLPAASIDLVGGWIDAGALCSEAP